MDSDVPVNQQDIKAAKNSDITILYSTPLCLEGMLLTVLGQKNLPTSKKCKDVLHPQPSGSPVLPISYEPLFTENILSLSKHPTIEELRSLLGNK